MSDELPSRIPDLKSIASIPTAEELDEIAERRYKESFRNPNNFENWHWAVVDSGVRSPISETWVITFEAQRQIMDSPEEAVETLQPIAREIKAFSQRFENQSAFIKTGVFSSKHFWNKTCHVGAETSVEQIANQICGIFYDGFCMGVPDSPHVVAREMIPTAPIFHAFGGQMPITQEFRLFSRAGEITSWQPYWPTSMFQDRPDYINDCPTGWYQQLRSIAIPSDELLAHMVEEATKVVSRLDDDWSIDFLVDDQGRPWLIDMALAGQSYVNADELHHL